MEKILGSVLRGSKSFLTASQLKKSIYDMIKMRFSKTKVSNNLKRFSVQRLAIFYQTLFLYPIVAISITHVK